MEDLTTFTETDPNGDLTITTSTATFDTMRRDAVAHVKKDYGAGNFGDFSISFEFKITASENYSVLAFLLLSSNPNFDTWYELISAANEGIAVYFYHNPSGSVRQVGIRDYGTANSQTYNISLNTAYFCNLVRSGTSISLYIYSDAAHTNLLATLTVTGTATTKQFLCFPASGGWTPPGDNYPVSGYVKSLELISESLEDAALDLSAYAQALDDLASFLRAHDGLEYRDLQMLLEAVSYTMLRDFGVSLDALAEDFSSLPALLQAARERLGDLGAFLQATDAIVLNDMACFLFAHDGSVMNDLGLGLLAIADIPRFRSITAQKVSAVIHDLS